MAPANPELRELVKEMNRSRLAERFRKRPEDNARAETAAEKPTFREAWAKHRCAIPASWYFEWEHDEKKRAGQKYALKPEGEDLIWLAGLYRMEGELPVFVILTRVRWEQAI